VSAFQGPVRPSSVVTVAAIHLPVSTESCLPVPLSLTVPPSWSKHPASLIYKASINSPIDKTSAGVLCACPRSLQIFLHLPIDTSTSTSPITRLRPRLDTPDTSATSPHNMSSSSSNVVGVHYRVGKKIGEGSFGVIFEGTNLLNNTQVAIKFVRPPQQQSPFRRPALTSTGTA
jgi:hypothetical protein